MFIRKIFTRFSREISEFQKSELGKFIANLSLKYVITSTNHTLDSNRNCTVSGVIL